MRRPRRRWLLFSATLLVLAIAPVACSSRSSPSANSGTRAGATIATDRSGDGQTTEAPPTTSAPTPACPDYVPGDPIKLSIWHALPDDAAKVLASTIDGFKRLHPEITIDLFQAGDFVALAQKLANTPQDQWPTLALLPEFDQRRFIDSKGFLSLSDCTSRNEALTDLLPSARSAFTVDRKLVAAPYAVSTPVLFANATSFQKAGLDPTTLPTTLADVRRASEKLVAAGFAKGFVFDVADLAGGSWFIEQSAAKAGQPIADADNGHAGIPTKIMITSGAPVETLTWLRKMVDDGLAQSVGDDGRETANLLRLVDAKAPAGMTVATSAAVPAILAVLQSGRFPGAKLAVGAFPGSGPGTLVGGSAIWQSAHGGLVQTAAGRVLLEYLMSPEQLAHWAATTGYLPSTSSAAHQSEMLELWRTNPEYKVGFDSISSGPANAAMAGAVLGPRLEARHLLAQATARIIQGNDVQTELDGAQSAIDKLLDAYKASVG